MRSRRLLSLSLSLALALSLNAVWRVRRRDARLELARSLGVFLNSLGGTNFSQADLTGATFQGARLRGANFRGANLTRVCWRDAEGLDEARFTDPALSDHSVRELLVSGDGRGKAYTGANLHGANLSHADLTGANLREANCTAADFTGAVLTGACLENWNIDSETRLNDVRCDYVFLLEKEDETGSRKRRPAEERPFEPGEFETLYRKMVQEMDLLLKKGLSGEAARNAFREMTEKHPDVRFHKFEDRGDSFLVGLTIPTGTKEADVERDLRGPWNRELQLESENRLLLERAKDLKEIALAAVSGGARAQIQIEGGIMSKQGNREINLGRDLRIENSQVGSVAGDVDRLVQSLGQSGSATGTAELGAMLNQLLQRVNAEPQLTPSEKEDAREQIGQIAQAAQAPQEPAMQRAARLGFGFLKGLADKLPDVTKLIEAGQKLFDTLQK